MRIQNIGAGLERVFLGSGAAQRTKLILKFEEELTEGGIHRALAFLNHRMTHRFTSVSRFDPPVLRGLFAYDRQRADILVGGRAQVLDESYAALVQRRKKPFVTENSQRDSRLAFHSARATMVAYVGVPIRLTSGELWGVLEHHDITPRSAPPAEVDLLVEVAPLLARWLKPQRVSSSGQLADGPPAA